ncbi:MAG: hypothetical protein ABI456_03565 [Ktedonobacteraceae bacterium]
MMWSPIQNRMRELIHKSEKERGEKEFNRRQVWGLRLRQRLQSGGGWLERGLAVVMLVVVALCGCCQPFRVWFISMVHMLATR